MINRIISCIGPASQKAFLMLLLVFGISATHIFGKTRNEKEFTQIRSESEIRQLIARVMEIKGMDRSIMDEQERESLKSELRLIQTDLQESSREQKTNKLGGVYISVGGIILILLILLIIL